MEEEKSRDFFKKVEQKKVTFIFVLWLLSKYYSRSFSNLSINLTLQKVGDGVRPSHWKITCKGSVFHRQIFKKALKWSRR